MVSKNDKKIHNTRNKLKYKLKDSSSDDDDIESSDNDSNYETESESESESESSQKRKSDSDSDSGSESDYESFDDSESESPCDDDNSAIDPHELRKTIATLFPSNYINDKVKDDCIKTNKTNKSSKSKSKTKLIMESDDSDSDYDNENDKYEDLFAAILGGGGASNNKHIDKNAILDKYDDDCNSDDEKLFMKESYKADENIESETVDSKNKHNKKHRIKSEKIDKNEYVDVEDEYKDLIELKKQLSEKLLIRPNSKILKNAIEESKSSIRKLVKKSRMKNAKKYYKMVNKEDENQTSEIDFFKKKLSNKEQLRAINELEEINEHMNIKKPYRLTLLDSNIPPKYKANVMQKLNMLRSMDPCDSEYFKLKTWIDGFMRIPFAKYNCLDVNITDGIEKCSEFMENAKKQLDDCVYGLDDAKMQIMQMIGQWITNPEALGTAIAIKGPPGTGKTSLVREGISKILGREFAFIALGGTGDASFLEGHGYTYEGSMWGRIVQILMDSKCMNPVIYFDELDKVSDTPRGEEIIGILTHLTDTSQNSQYHDKYFSEISFDLSKCLFIFSYNDESKINPILRDRMYRIITKGYKANEKLVIARDFLMPKIREQVAFKVDELIIPDETITEIITNQSITNGEEGVRNLKRCLEIIHTKINLFRLMKPENNIFAKHIDLQITFPLTVTNAHVKKLLDYDNPNQSFLAMYV